MHAIMISIKKAHTIYADFLWILLFQVTLLLIVCTFRFLNIHNQYEINSHKHDYISSNSLSNDVENEDDNELFCYKVDLRQCVSQIFRWSHHCIYYQNHYITVLQITATGKLIYFFWVNVCVSVEKCFLETRFLYVGMVLWNSFFQTKKR